MGRRTWRWDRELGRLIEVTPQEVGGQHFVRGELTPFVSPIDGTVIDSRAKYEDHCRKHNVIPTQELQGNTREYDRYQADRDRRALRERLWEGVDRAHNQRRR